MNTSPVTSTHGVDTATQQAAVINATARIEVNASVDSAGKLVSDNLYWYSTQTDAVDYSTTPTPVTNYANLTGLNALANNRKVTTFGSADTLRGTQKEFEAIIAAVIGGCFSLTTSATLSSLSDCSAFSMAATLAF